MNWYKGMAVSHSKLFPGKPTIVFLHDSLGCIELWRDFPQKLATATECNLLIYDRLGYGKSAPLQTHVRPVNYLEQEADILYELLNTTGTQQAILFGHSDGGTIALLAASKYPKKIKAIISEAAHIFVEDITLKGISEAKKAYEQTDLPDRLKKYHADKVETLFKAWVETWTRADYRDWNVEHFLSGVVCPLLFIQGEADEYGTLNQVNKSIEQISGFAESYIISNAGHTPHKEMPDITLSISSKFISKVLKSMPHHDL